MKDRPPLKRCQALVSFSKDHHFGLLLTWKIKQGLANAVAPERISNYVLYFFENDLQHHFKEEEELLFPKLPAESRLRQQAEREHAVIYNIIERIKTDKANEALLQQFADTLKEHIRFEERELFALIQQSLTDPESEIVTTHSNRSNETDGRWDDIFWVIDKSGLQRGTI